MANDFGHDGLEVGKVDGKHRVSHPGHAEHGGDGDAAAEKTGVLPMLEARVLQKITMKAPQASMNIWMISVMERAFLPIDRAKFREHAEDGDGSNTWRGRSRGSPLFGTEGLADEGRRFAVDVLRCSDRR